MWRPEQIVDRLEMEQGVGVGHEWIYQQVYADKRSGAADRCGVIPDRTSIDERPAVVDARRRIGDWEVDTMIGKGHLGALVTLVERKSRHAIIRAVPRKTAEAVRNAEIKHAMDKLNHRPRKTLGFRTPHEVFFNTKTS